MSYHDLLAVIALVVAAVALWRAWTPPQARQVRELTTRVIDCEEAWTELANRLTARSKKENMAKARDVHEARAAELQDVERQAQLILQGGAAPAKPPAPATPDELRAQLRAQLRPGRTH